MSTRFIGHLLLKAADLPIGSVPHTLVYSNDMAR